MRETREENAFSVREKERASTASLEGEVRDCVDNILKGVSVDAQLSEHQIVITQEEPIAHMIPPSHPCLD